MKMASTFSQSTRHEPSFMNGPQPVKGVYWRRSYTLEQANGYDRLDRSRPILRMAFP